MRTLILGNGNIGCSLLNHKQDLLSLTRNDLDFHDFHLLKLKIKNINPDLIINSVAYTNVDQAEVNSESEVLNIDLPEVLTEIADSFSAKLIHYSTDYVFDGESDTPYTELSTPNPINKYGEHKLKGEEKVLQYNKSLVIRLSSVYSNAGHCFPKTILKLIKNNDFIEVVNDQIVSPTYSEFIASITFQILDNFKSGIYHLTSRDSTNWFEFAREISDNNQKIIPTTSKDYVTLAKRPRYSLLDNTKIEEDFGIIRSYWRDQLHQWKVKEFC